MNCQGVFVSYSMPGSEILSKNSGKFSGSGIKYDNDWVLIHGSFLSPLNKAHILLESQKSNNCINVNIFSNFPEITVTINNGFVISDNKISTKIEEKSGKIVHIWQSSLLSQAFKMLKPNWTFGKKQRLLGVKDEYNLLFLSSFGLLFIGEHNIDNESVRQSLLMLYNASLQRSPIRGEQLYLECTPFGNEVFLNSKTTGVVCNIVGPEDCLILCDAVSTLCCEGGLAVLEHEKKVLGMIVNSLSWWQGEWVGLTLLCSISVCLSEFSFIKDYHKSISLFPRPISFLTHTLDVLDSAIVFVRCGESWGSAIYLGNDLFLTCSHVIKNYKIHPIKIYCKGHSVKAKTLVNSQNDKAYDLALLRANFCNEKLLSKVYFATSPAVQGETVIAVGFPYFSEMNTKNLKPTIVKGNVTKVTPFMLQTSCCIQAGYSGGAIIRLYKRLREEELCCELLGIIVCNIKVDRNNFIHPFVNMAIPVNIFQNLLEKKSLIEDLKFEDDREIVQSIWKFQFPHSKL